MDFKLPENILEFLKFQKRLVYKYHKYVKDSMKTNYKKAALLVYWLNDYLAYIKAEATFNPSMNIAYKRGQVVFVNFGYRIGSELGGEHYAIVLDVKNSKHSKTLTVLPLKSNKNKTTAYSKIYYFSLGTKVKTLLVEKANSIINENFNEALGLAQVITAKKEVHPEYDPKEDAELVKTLSRLKRNRRIADNILLYAQKLNNESVADIGQIITISKQRIKHPCKTSDVLTGVIIDENTMLEISKQIEKFYVGHLTSDN